MNKKLLILVVFGAFTILLGGMSSTVLFGTQYTATKPGYFFSIGPWWNTSWSYRKLIFINHSQVDSDLTNFPILINITDTDLRDDAQDDGDDIAFVMCYDVINQLNHEIEQYDNTTGHLVAWVNITSLSSSRNTTFYMYYGNSTCSSQENVAGTWDSNYVLIHHLNETSGTFYDSTSYSNDGSVQGNPTYAFSGKMGYAVDLDGTGDAINVSDDTSLDFDHNITLETWVNLDTWNHWRNILFKGDNTAGNTDFQFATATSGGDLAWDGTLGGSWRTQYFNTERTTYSWLYLVMVHSQAAGQEVEAFRNGSSLGSNSDVGVIYHSTEDLCMGGLYTGGSVSMEIDGRIDEVRISNTARSAAWISTSYNTMNNTSTFLIIQNEEIQS